MIVQDVVNADLGGGFASIQIICLWAGWFHYHRAVPSLFGLGSIAWAGHLIHVAVPTHALGAVGWVGGLDPVSDSLWLTDVAHHHLAIGCPSRISWHLTNQLMAGFAIDMVAPDTTGIHGIGVRL